MLEPLTLDKLDDQDRPQERLILSKGRLKSLEKKARGEGFSAGYRKAKTEREALDTDIISCLSEKIQEVSFTYFEARNAALKSLSPLLNAIISSLLPAAARHTLVPIVSEQLLRIAKSSIGETINVGCAPKNVDVLHAYFSKLPEFSARIKVVPNESTGPLDVSILTQNSESTISMAEIITLIEQETNVFFAQLLQDQHHG